MCIAANQTDQRLQFPLSGRTRDGTGKTVPRSQQPLEVTFDRPRRAVDVPLGSGAADAASLAIRSRRERLREAEGND